jgi:hypothetical protein
VVACRRQSIILIYFSMNHLRASRIGLSVSTLVLSFVLLPTSTYATGLPTCELSASPSTMTAGGSTTLTLGSSFANHASIDNGVGTVAVSGTTSVSPAVTTTYTATVTHEFIPEDEEEFVGTCSTTVVVTPVEETAHHSSHPSGPVHPAGQVLGAETVKTEPVCGPLLTTYMSMEQKNDTTEVKKLQEFLNKDLGGSLPVSGVYGADTKEAVRAFQAKYWEEVLLPWFSIAGSPIHTKSDTTGNAYKTTIRQINNLFCPSLHQPMPQLP